MIYIDVSLYFLGALVGGVQCNRSGAALVMLMVLNWNVLLTILIHKSFFIYLDLNK